MSLYKEYEQKEAEMEEEKCFNKFSQKGFIQCDVNVLMTFAVTNNG